MNCEEVMDVLDNGSPDRLDAERRRRVDAHVAVCTSCARAWNLQAGLAALPDMAMPMGFAGQCRVVVAAGSPPVAGNRIARRLWLAGAAVSLAAVAALLLFPRSPHAPAADAVVQVVEASAATAPIVEEVSLEPVPAVVPATIVEAAPEPRFTVNLVPYHKPTEEELKASDQPTVLQELARSAIRANTSDPAREQTLHALHAALLVELRKVPGLTLVQSDPQVESPSGKHFRLTLNFVAMTTVRGELAPINSRYVAVGMGIEQLLGGKYNRRGVPIPGSIDLQAGCSSATATADAPCNDVPGVATSMVKTLLKEVFPPPSAVTRPLQAKFSDASLELAQRLAALDELYKLQLRTGTTGLLRDPGVVRAAIAMAATADPVLRARLWRTMRGAGNAELIQPMLASLAQDPEDVRLAALETLSADFIADEGVRTALQATAKGDQRPLVRAVAERGLSGEATWRQYVVASLKDAGRNAPERVEALVYTLYPPGPTRETSTSPPEYSQMMQELLDDDAVRALAEAIPDSGGLGAGGNNLLGNFGVRYRTNPAVPEMMLRVLENDSKPLMRAVAGSHLARFHAGEPRTREALIKALNNDPDERVRAAIRSLLGNVTQ